MVSGSGCSSTISHVSDETLEDVFRHPRKAPVIASHLVDARHRARPAKSDRSTNSAPSQDNGGVAMMNFFSGFLDPEHTSRRRRTFEIAHKEEIRRIRRAASQEATVLAVSTLRLGKLPWSPRRLPQDVP